MGDHPQQQSEWRWRMDRSDRAVDALELWQLNVIAEITSVKTDVATIKVWFQIGTVSLLGMVASIAIWLITGHKP